MKGVEMKQAIKKGVLVAATLEATANVGEELPRIRVVKIGTCPTLSGNSTLTYHVGCSEAEDIYLRLFANSTAGCFNKEWIAVSAIAEILDGLEREHPLTCFTLRGMFLHKSANSPGFLLAVLKEEGWVGNSVTHKRCYGQLSRETFMVAIKKLIDAKVEFPDVTPTPPIQGPRKVPAKRSNNKAKRLPCSDRPVVAVLNDGQAQET